MRKVIDISGDGANNDGRPVTAARDEARDKGISINGLPVMLKQASYFDIDNLDVYYEDCVITGIGAFVIPIRERHQFVEATRTKLLREIAEVPAAPERTGPEGAGAEAATPPASRASSNGATGWGTERSRPARLRAGRRRRCGGIVRPGMARIAALHLGSSPPPMSRARSPAGRA